jgi:pre-rRNA-processing protein IPI3
LHYTHTISIFSQSHLYIDEASSYSTEELLRDHAYFVQPLAAVKNGDFDPASLKSKASELESEVESLRDQLCKAKDINDAMWDNVVKRLVSQIKDPELPANGNNESMEDDQRRKKKGRAT